MNIRTALLYKKNLATLIEESVRSKSAVFCGGDVDLAFEGHWESTPVGAELSFRRRPAPEGAPAFVLHRLRVLGQVSVYEMRSPLL